MEEKITATRKMKFTEKDLKSIRKKTMRSYWLESPLDCFWNEIKAILRTTEKPASWKKLKGKHIHGDVWQQVIGQYMHHHTVHRFAWLYVKDTGETVSENRFMCSPLKWVATARDKQSKYPTNCTKLH